jgi:stearoyl-CoA desaturase (Delta-9 desaturase)
MTSTFERAPDERIAWGPSLPFFLFHLLPLVAIYTGVHWSAWVVCFVLYYARVFFLTGVYHRYLAHRSYQMGRVMQFLMCVGGASALQKGPLWWAAHHRLHHKHSDQPEDVHSPKRGFWWSHMNWILCPKYEETRFDIIPDFAKYPELRLINRFHWVPPLLLGSAVLILGAFISGSLAGAFGYAVIGFALSTIFLWHSTFLVNSVAHVLGTRRFATRDTSRNNLVIALLTGGEGWHNNHHHYPASCRQGFYWYEIDPTYYMLKGLSMLRLVRNLKAPPENALNRHLIKQGAADIGMFENHWERALKSLANAQSKAGEAAADQKQAIDELVTQTREKVDELARMSVERAKSIIKQANPERS